MARPKKVVLLGATGSIGENTLAVIRKHPEAFKLVGVAANRNRRKLDEIATEFKVSKAHLFEDSGLDGLMELATLKGADSVIVATTGTVGVRPTIAALEAGKTVGLANKETLVFAGRFVMEKVGTTKGKLLPVDSEHNAVWQCLEGLKDRSQLKTVHLTASGGPFLNHTDRELAEVTLEEALKHPNWDMGMKVTIDSATMANKGLEMIEARWLFDLKPEQVNVIVHPQSLIHSMAEFIDGSIIAQLAPPSMTFPVQHVLSWPRKLESSYPTLDFSQIHRLDLRPPDLVKFPCLRLARDSMAAGGLAPALFNVANEVAVDSFASNEIPYLAIPQFIENIMEAASFEEPDNLEDLLGLEETLFSFTRDRLKSFSPR